MRGHLSETSRFPHSETAGSKVDGTSPTSIVAVYVLPRSKSPRHPLLALLVNLVTSTRMRNVTAHIPKGIRVLRHD